MDTISAKLIMLSMKQHVVARNIADERHAAWIQRISDLDNGYFFRPPPVHKSGSYTQEESTKTAPTESVASATETHDNAESAKLAVDEVTEIPPTHHDLEAVDGIDYIPSDIPEELDRRYEDVETGPPKVPDVTDAMTGKDEMIPTALHSVTSPVTPTTNNKLPMEDKEDQKFRSNWKVLQDLILNRR